LYIGNLPFNTGEEDLKQLFERAGAVESTNVIRDKFTSKSRGFGFVEMKSDEDGNKAIEMFNGQEIEGRVIVVNEAKPQQPRGGGRS